MRASEARYNVSIRIECSYCGWHKRFNIPENLNVFHWVWMILDHYDLYHHHTLYVNYDLCDFFLR
jgi:hypothetical protein